MVTAAPSPSFKASPQIHRGQYFNDIRGIGRDLRQYNGTPNLALYADRVTTCRTVTRLRLQSLAGMAAEFLPHDFVLVPLQPNIECTGVGLKVKPISHLFPNPWEPGEGSCLTLSRLRFVRATSQRPWQEAGPP